MARPILTTKTQRHQEKLTKFPRFHLRSLVSWCLGGQRFDSSAAQRGNDDHFVAGLQAMVQAGDAVPVHEETDVRTDSILFVRDRRLCLKFTAFNIRD